jgi:hypothetical protein
MNKEIIYWYETTNNFRFKRRKEMWAAKSYYTQGPPRTANGHACILLLGYVTL